MAFKKFINGQTIFYNLVGFEGWSVEKQFLVLVNPTKFDIQLKT